MNNQTTICAIATPSGSGALAIIRISGNQTFFLLNKIFKAASGETINEKMANRIIFGSIFFNNELLDEVLVSVFKAPHSYTGEDSVEINCHGSIYIQQQILQTLISHGAIMAEPGEFTLRAFLNHKFDLTQAEAVADIIASHSKASHNLAINQMRGEFSKKINQLRNELIKFTSLIELELDFSEEDVEFAKRKDLLELLNKIKKENELLIESFSVGNVLKNGIPVAIIGKPNVGKSTLLNILLNDDKALVSEIPGTTRDAIEDNIIIRGVSYRFIDTAGLRQSEDTIENMGIEKTWEKINQASIILYIFDISETSVDEIIQTIDSFSDKHGKTGKKIIAIANMIDKLVEMPKGFKDLMNLDVIFVSAKRRENIHLIIEALISTANNLNNTEGIVISNARHYQALVQTNQALDRVEHGINGKIPTDLVAQDLREALHHLGLITGVIVNDEILQTVFKNFCIGK